MATAAFDIRDGSGSAVPVDLLENGLAKILDMAREPDSVQFKSLSVITDEITAVDTGTVIRTRTLCGLMNGRNGFGGMTGFVGFSVSNSSDSPDKYHVYSQQSPGLDGMMFEVSGCIKELSGR